jgi:hypothetical protein
MTPLTASAPALSSAEVPKFYTQAAQLEKMTLADSAPWLYSALAQLWELEQAGAILPGVGDLRIADGAATTARLLFSLINVTDLPAPAVSPVSGGSLSIVWSMGSKEVKFSCYPDGQALYFKCQDDDLIEDGAVNLAVADSARAAVTWMAQP